MNEHTNQIFCGHSLDVLKTLPAESIDVCVTSPPYWGLRKYDAPDVVWGEQDGCVHHWSEHRSGLLRDNRNNLKGTQEECRGATGTAYIKSLDESTAAFCTNCNAWRGPLGLEQSFDGPHGYISHLIQIFAEVKRVLKKTGTCFIILGDSYNTSPPGNKFPTSGFQSQQMAKNPDYNACQPRTRGISKLPPKSLCLIPYRFAIAMTDQLGFCLRNIIVWHKVNCMPSSAKDRFTNDFETVLFFSKTPHYFFTQQFELYAQPLDRWGGLDLVDKGNSEWSEETGQPLYRNRNMRPDPQGRNARAVWTIKTRPSGEKHFAVFPPELVEKILKAAAPEFVCKKCGKPREKIMQSNGQFQRRWSKKNAAGSPYQKQSSMQNIYESIGLSDCGCGAGFEPSLILDPFLGIGTTALVAKQMGFNYIGIELSETYTKIAERALRKTTRQPELTFGEK